jgi:ATP-dependent HslUV protease ATP-binding subunit HslU
MKTEKVDLILAPEALAEIARFAALANEQMENIGARRLHTILEKVLDEISFAASEQGGKPYKVDAPYVNKCLEAIIKNQDLSRYIL